MAMTKENKEILQVNHMKLTNAILDIKTVIGYLFASKTITDEIRERLLAVLANEARSSAIRELLTLLPRLGNGAFDEFYNALVNANENTAADILKPDMRSQREVSTNSQYANQYQVIREPRYMYLYFAHPPPRALLFYYIPPYYVPPYYFPPYAINILDPFVMSHHSAAAGLGTMLSLCNIRPSTPRTSRRHSH